MNRMDHRSMRVQAVGQMIQMNQIIQMIQVMK